MSLDMRLVLVSLVLLGGVLLIEMHKRSERIPPHQSLEMIPRRVDRWTGEDLTISSDVLRTLGSGAFLSRVYQDMNDPGSSVTLFVGYFPSQSTGDTIHSPENCLPGSGWFPIESETAMVSIPGNAAFEAKRYYVAKGTERALVMYWYQAHGRKTASEYRAKFFLVEDSVRWNRSDGAFIRITTRQGHNEPFGSTEQRLKAFTIQIVPVIDAHLPY